MRGRREELPGGTWILGAIVALAVASCGGEAPAVGPPSEVPTVSPASPSPTASVGPTATGSPSAGSLGDVAVSLTPVARVDAAIAMAVRTGDRALYIATKDGRVVALREGRQEPVLDVTGQVSDGSEQGLLGLAFGPDGGFMYVNYTDREGDTNVDEYAFRDGRADPATRRRVIFIDQPFGNHNGGNLAFGPDGFLYIGMGDGGSQGDPQGNGQNLQALLAKMLRIDPRANGEAPYSVPGDNPFVGRNDARPEVWASGLRNPWRYSFDHETGDLWIGDVGGGAEEEIDFEPAGSGGRNYGWNLIEGTTPHTADLPDDLVPPVFTYPTHDRGTCAITGGYVYRGSAIPGLVGAYLYSDFCGGDIRALRHAEGSVAEETSLGISSSSLASFGQDQDGELYVLCLCGDVFRIDPA